MFLRVCGGSHLNGVVHCLTFVVIHSVADVVLLENVIPLIIIIIIEEGFYLNSVILDLALLVLDSDALLGVDGAALLAVLHLLHRGALVAAARLQDDLALLVKHLPAVPPVTRPGEVGAGGLVTLLLRDHIVTHLYRK